MIKPPPTKNESERLATLQAYAVLDTQAEKDFDDLVELAAYICGTPIAHISLVDEKRQWFKASFGSIATETSRDVSFCGHTITQSGQLIVPNVEQDERFVDNPLVIGEPGIRFYAGSPLIAPDGNVLGALCVIDHKPRQISAAQSKGLLVLSRQAMVLLELHKQAREMTRSNDALLGILEDERLAKTAMREGEDQIAEQASFLDKTQDAIIVRDLKSGILFWNKGAEEMYGWPREEVLGRDMDKLLYAVPTKFEEVSELTISQGE